MIERVAIYPTHISRLNAIKNKIYEVIGVLSASALVSDEPIPYAELEGKEFVPAEAGFPWGGQFSCAWFRFKGSVPVEAKGKHVVLLLDIGGEGGVYASDGDVIQGLTGVLNGADAVQTVKGKKVVDIFKTAKGGENIEILVDAGNNGNNGNFFGDQAHLKRKDIAIKNDDIYKYYYDYLTLFAILLTKNNNEIMDKARYKEIIIALNSSYKLFKNKDISGATEVLEAEISKPNDRKTVKYTAIGHAHLDLGWLWPIRETKRKAVRTFATALYNMEKYPDYIFGASQAQQFEWIKKINPKLYERLKKAVANGRMEIQGGMWTENDSNVPSGESLIRQQLFGYQFFGKEFGVYPKNVWLPDAFGYPACLPQIFKKCGKDYFFTIKLTWNEHNAFPYKTFKWIGIDGSEVLAHMAPEGTYNSSASPLAVIKSDKNFAQKDQLDSALIVYGAGDGGGGPGEANIEYLVREKNIKGLDTVTMASAESYFEALEKEKSKLPEYKGELYLEKHQGTYTSQGRNKLYNRLMENELHNVEWLSALLKTRGESYEAKERVEKIWKEVLLYQFHDILPGSSINRIYTESVARYKEMYAEIISIRDELIQKIGEGQIGALNLSPFMRDEYLKVDGKWVEAKAAPYASATFEEAPQNSEELKIGDDFIENDLVKIVFSSKGYITSYYDKAVNKELVKGYANKLVLYSDPKKHYNAWDIDWKYPKMASKLMSAKSRRAYIDGLNAIMEIEYATAKSTIKQKVVITLGRKEAVFDTIVDWHEKYKMLRADFTPVAIGDVVNCDIQFGTITRSAKDVTPEEKAQFEICAHKYVQTQKDGSGFAIINNCKYGYRVKEGLISLNLLRSPKYPDPECDMCEHNIGYAMYPFEGDVEDSGLVEQAYAFNNPLILSDSMPEIAPLIEVKGKGVVLETVKISEDGEGIVARLYERYGRNASVTVNANFDYTRLTETNMLELDGKSVKCELEFTPFEIKTLYFKL